MASNLVYETIQDNDGFLWVATDNGISRFDGKRFINYTTKNGLPSNDVIQVIKQNDGTIWANCYKQPPSYFDDKLNRFICLEYDKHVLDISNGLLNIIYSINKDDLFFHNYLGSFVYSKGKIIKKIKYSTNDIKKYYLFNELITIKNYDSVINSKQYFVYSLYNQNKLVGVINYDNSNNSVTTHYSNTAIYNFFTTTFTQIKIINLNPLKYKITTIKTPETLKWFKFSNTKLSITCTNGTVLIYDEKTMQLLSTIKNVYNVNTAYVDKQNNVWIATLNNGLMYYTNKTIKKEVYSDNVVSNFLCAKVTGSGVLYAGNYQGEIYVKKEIKEEKFNFNKVKKNNLWIRNIHFFQNKTIVVSDDGILVNFNKRCVFFNNLNQKLSVKTSTKLNENVLILGSIQGLIKYDVTSEKYQILNFNKELVLNVKRKDDSTFYDSSNDTTLELKLLEFNKLKMRSQRF